MNANGADRRSLETAPHLWRGLFVTPFVAWTGWNLWVAETIAWAWLAAGFVTTAVTVGPVAASPVGVRIGNWFDSIGYTGRAVVMGFAIAVLVAVIWVAEPVFSVPAPLVDGAWNGVVLGVAAVVAVEALLSRNGE